MIISQLPEAYLDRKQEAAIAVEIQKHQRDSDIEKLVMSNVREAAIYVRACCRSEIEEGEIISLVYGTLKKNAKRFRPEFGTRFLAFAKAGLRGDAADYWKTIPAVRNSKGMESLDVPEYVRQTVRCGASELATNEGQNQDMVELERVGVADPEWEAIYFRERWEQVKPLMETVLTEHERMVLVLAYINGFGYQEIGKLLGISRSAVQGAQVRALSKLRCALRRSERLLRSE